MSDQLQSIRPGCKQPLKQVLSFSMKQPLTALVQHKTFGLSGGQGPSLGWLAKHAPTGTIWNSSPRDSGQQNAVVVASLFYQSGCCCIGVNVYGYCVHQEQEEHADN